MKFLCDNCKAKYQIADEKVAGKTVRMKCRKCGHQIEVRAAVTETSVATKPPQAPRPAAQSSLATSLSAQKPRAPMAPHAPEPPSALAGAFQKNVQDAAPQSEAEPASQQPVELSVSNEWYVAINGVPVGPVRIGELRRKAASGAVTEDSLCWQEGLEEWRPVRSIPDLAALVREAASGNRPSLLGDAPRPPSRIPPPPAPRPAAPLRPEATRPLVPPGPQRSNVVPLHRDGAPLAAPLGGAAAARAPSPSMAPQPQPVASLAPSPFATPSPTAVADPFAVPAAPIPTASLAPPAPSFLPPAPERRGVPLWFWPVLVLALGFGGGLAFVIFRPPAAAPVVIHMPSTATPTSTGDKTTDNVPPPAPTENAPAPATTGGGGPTKPAAVAMGGGKASPATPTPASTEKKTADLSGLLGGGGTGPTGGPAAAGGGGAGQGLDSAAVERVVGQHRAGVKRTCWERVSSDKGNVSVTVSATVAPDGSVSNATSSGDDPMVGKCIENQVRSWRFPAPGSTTTVNIPFKFFRQ